MNAQDTAIGHVKWLVDGLAQDVPGIRQVVLVSSDGLLLAAAGDGGSDGAASPGGERLGAIVSGLVSLAQGAARVMDLGEVRQEIVTMAEGHVVAMSISDGSCLGVHASGTSDLAVIAYQMTAFVRRAGHVLTPALRAELHKSHEPGNEAGR
ncbi:roadblock/LC7 domain-containing protein [Yinghuangia seranimata]|uniref:roadblock/LC7 domain-containing protein n=1 Tax=Yinghuangia seranimata TaxID=408067 RepID=UPI00248B91F6|nr:roadblock/LC7 domain-containing protein [Yinghuangia seranimata]MDI2128227.1 roadblock/LC7 domain-containing protein [Yinghuangia seranimata]